MIGVDDKTNKFALISPRAVHALVATLVQVVNTTSRPGSTIDNSKTAQMNVELQCNQPDIRPGICQPIRPSDAGDVGGYVVPAGYTLIVTSIDFVPGPVAQFNLLQSLDYFLHTTNVRESFAVPPGASPHLKFPTGIAFGPGNTIGESGNWFQVGTLRGYPKSKSKYQLVPGLRRC